MPDYPTVIHHPAERGNYYEFVKILSGIDEGAWRYRTINPNHEECHVYVHYGTSDIMDWLLEYTETRAEKELPYASSTITVDRWECSYAAHPRYPGQFMLKAEYGNQSTYYVQLAKQPKLNNDDTMTVIQTTRRKLIRS